MINILFCLGPSKRSITRMLPYVYNKIITGSEQSKYDFEYISKFNFECWNQKIKNNNFISIDIDSYTDQLCQKHIQYLDTGLINVDDLIELLSILDDKIEKNKEYFVRLSYRSAKDVIEGRMPVTNSEQILYAIIKSERCFDDMIAHKYHQFNPLYIHLVDWQNCNQDRELRCFIFEKKLVAITNQFSSWLFKNQELQIIYEINKFVDDLYNKHKDLYDSCVIDIELSSELVPKLIEFNPYYEKGSTGAILFNWNENLLYKPGSITLRFCKDRYQEIIVKN